MLLFSYLFLVIGSFVAGKATRDALFLFRFSARQLPYVDIAVALLVGVWVAIYIRHRPARLGAHAHLRQPRLLRRRTPCSSGTCRTCATAPWVLPVVYVWVGMFGVIAAAQVWTLANYVLTTREAKRLFGFIGSGAISGNIVGGFVVQQTATRFGAESTSIGMAGGAAGCARCWSTGCGVCGTWRSGRIRMTKTCARRRAAARQGCARACSRSPPRPT